MECLWNDKLYVYTHIYKFKCSTIPKTPYVQSDHNKNPSLHELQPNTSTKNLLNLGIPQHCHINPTTVTLQMSY